MSKFKVGDKIAMANDPSQLFGVVTDPAPKGNFGSVYFDLELIPGREGAWAEAYLVHFVEPVKAEPKVKYLVQRDPMGDRWLIYRTIEGSTVLPEAYIATFTDDKDAQDYLDWKNGEVK